MKSTIKMSKALLGVEAILLLTLMLSGDAAAQCWIKLSTTGEPPSPKSGAIISVYDAASNRLITFGGNTVTPCCTPYNDVWVLTNANGLGGTPQWIKLNPTGPAGFPPARGHHSAVYDSANNRMIIFGGGQWNQISPGFFIFVPRFNDVWVLTNANGLGGTPEWVPLSPTGGPPAPRELPRAIYDPASNRMTIFGGGNNGILDVPNDVWVLTNANGLGGAPAWIQLNPIGQIPPRTESHTATYDPASNRMTIFGGFAGSFTNNTFVLTNANGLGGTPEGIQLSPTGTLPAGRGTHVYGYHPTQNRLVIFGQGNSSGQINDTWVLTNANGLGGTPQWINTIPNGASGSPPAAITIQGGVYDSVSNRLISVQASPDVPAAIALEVWVLTEAPVIGTVTVDKPFLWPPNHKMLDVMVNYTTVDNCGPSTCSLSVTNNEPIDGLGDGDTAPDWIVVDSHHVQLRAERSGKGNGRTYTITVNCVDGVGNQATPRTATVMVQHDTRKQ